MMPRLGQKYEIGIETISKPNAEYVTDEYFEQDLLVDAYGHYHVIPRHVARHVFRRLLDDVRQDRREIEDGSDTVAEIPIVTRPAVVAVRSAGRAEALAASQVAQHAVGKPRIEVLQVLAFRFLTFPGRFAPEDDELHSTRMNPRRFPCS